MKDDFEKLLTEQERAGPSDPSVRWRRKVNYDPDSGYEDEIGCFVASSPRRHLSHKEFTDLLSPLRGNLRKNVGPPRNDGSGEICRGMDRRKMAVHHLEAPDKSAHAAIAIGASEN